MLLKNEIKKNLLAFKIVDYYNYFCLYIFTFINLLPKNFSLKNNLEKISVYFSRKPEQKYINLKMVMNNEYKQ